MAAIAKRYWLSSAKRVSTLMPWRQNFKKKGRSRLCNRGTRCWALLLPRARCLRRQVKRVTSAEGTRDFRLDTRPSTLLFVHILIRETKWLNRNKDAGSGRKPHHECAGCRCRRNPREDPRHRTKTISGIFIRPQVDCQTDGRGRQEACRGLEV